MNTVKCYSTIHVQLNQINVLEYSNTSNGLSNKVCIPFKIEDLNINVFNMIIGKK